MKPTGRIEWLDLVRGLAAVVVVFYHYRAYLHVRPAFYAFLAVDVFFVLSGIVLGMRYTAAIEQGMRFGPFVAARLRRLYPMVVIAAVLVAAVSLVTSGPSWAFLRVLLLWPVLDESAARLSFPDDGPMWSLWAELVVNVVWFMLLKAGRWSVLVLGASALAGALVVAAHFDSMDFGAGSGAAALASGILRAMAWFSIGYGISQGAFRRLLRPWTLFVLLLAATAVVAVVFHRPWLNQVFVVASAAGLLQALLASSPPGAGVARLARWLGLASYPLYLIHSPLKSLLEMPGVPRGWLPMLTALCVATALATWLNEALVARLMRWRATCRPALAEATSLTA